MIEQFSRQGSPASRARRLEQEARGATRETVLDLLLRRQDGQGGWPAAPALPPTTEATALGLLAVSSGTEEVGRHSARRAASWLLARQRPDGSWPHSDQVEQGDWSTSLAILALSRLPEGSGPANEGARWLLGQEGRSYSWIAKLIFLLFPEREAVQLDPDLTGWPWYPDTFSWIEPTAYALLALKSRRPAVRGRGVRERIDEAERMIMDRECLGGGWNYGNSRVLDEELWPYPDTTALALIALQDYRRPAGLERSLTTLEAMTKERASVLGLALGVLALQLHARDVTGVRSRLVARLGSGPLPSDTRSLVFAALALDAGTMPLSVPIDPLRKARSSDG